MRQIQKCLDIDVPTFDFANRGIIIHTHQMFNLKNMSPEYMTKVYILQLVLSYFLLKL